MPSGLKFDPPSPGSGAEGTAGPDDGAVVEYRHVMQLIGDLNGIGVWSRQKNFTGFTHDTEYLMRLFNNGAGGKHLDIQGAFNVETAATTAENALIGQSTLAITGAATFNSTVHAVGAVDFDSTLNVDGAATLQSTLHGIGAVDFDSTLNVDGAATFLSTVAVTGAATFASTVAVTGAATFNGAVTLGDAAGDTITVTGTATFTPLATFAGGVTLSGGNLTFTTTGQRITGDFSNATVTNRLLFQTSSANNHSFLGLIPNGTGIIASYQAYAASNPAASAYIQMAAVGGVDVRIASEHNGAAYLPLIFMNNGAEQMRIAANGDITIAPAAGKVGFYAKAPVAQGSVGAAATDPATTQTLVNNIRTLLRDLGLSS